MRRREFIAGLGTVAVWPAGARPADKRPHVAVLTLLSPEDRGGRTAAFVTGMRELGYIPGQTVDFDYRYAYGKTDRLRALAQELIALAPDVFFAEEPSGARAVKALAPPTSPSFVQCSPIDFQTSSPATRDLVAASQVLRLCSRA